MRFNLIATFLLIGHLALAVEYSDKKISVLRPGGDRRCVLFQLAGINQADPAYASPWFSVPFTAVGYNEMYALLLASKLIDKPIGVTTTGSVESECGHMGVAVIQAN
jgi:hypothetical protein